AGNLLQYRRTELRSREHKRTTKVVPDILVAVGAVLSQVEDVRDGRVGDRERLYGNINTVRPRVIGKRADPSSKPLLKRHQCAFIAGIACSLRPDDVAVIL